VAARFKVNVFVVFNGSRPIRPPGTTNVRMVLVENAQTRPTTGLPSVSQRLMCASRPISRWPRAASKKAPASSPRPENIGHKRISNALAGREIARYARVGREYPWTRPFDQTRQVTVSRRARYGSPSRVARGATAKLLAHRVARGSHQGSWKVASAQKTSERRGGDSLGLDSHVTCSVGAFVLPGSEYRTRHQAGRCGRFPQDSRA
jgi:hypothetical protein